MRRVYIIIGCEYFQAEYLENVLRAEKRSQEDKSMAEAMHLSLGSFELENNNRKSTDLDLFSQTLYLINLMLQIGVLYGYQMQTIRQRI